MSRWLQIACVGVSAALGCGGSYPAPAQGLANAESAARAARDVGAGQYPQAALYLQMAEEGMAEAKQVMEGGDNRRAEEILLRARADGELSAQLTREATAQAEYERAEARLKAAQGHAHAAPSEPSATPGGAP